MLLAFLFPCLHAMAQRQVSGKVVSEDQQPVPGVTVKVKGGNSGTVTDGKGVFSITVAGGTILQFSSLGFVPQELPANDGGNMTVVLMQDKKALSEVVVTALGIKKEK